MTLNLQHTLDIAATMCPAVTYMWANFTFKGVVTMDAETDLPSLICQVSNLQWYGVEVNNRVSIASFVVSPIGIFCCCLALHVFTNKKCSEVTFAYHRAINIADIIWLLFVFELGIFNMGLQAGVRFSAWEAFHTVFGNRIDNCFSDFVELTVAWISVERACTYLPKVFQIINQKKTAYMTMGILFVIAFGLILPYGFELTVAYDPALLIYKRVYSTFGASSGFKTYSTVYNVILTCRMILVVVGTCGTILVLLLINRNKRQLRATIGAQSSTSDSLLRQSKANQMLCILQLCEAIPIIIKCIIILNLKSLTVGFTYNEFISLTYKDALALIDYYRYSMDLLTVKKIVDYCSHALHFILYCCLSKRIRTTAFEMLKQAYNSVVNSDSMVQNNGIGKRTNAVNSVRLS